MQPALSTPFALPPIPAWGELSENSRLGFTSNNPALYLGHDVCNSTTALGFESSLLLNGIRSRCSGEQYDPDLGLYYLRARYYNPTTGTFMSRDPLDGHISIPVTLHKYLYASGNPVNRIDPSGRDDLVQVAQLDERSLTTSVNYAARQLNIERQLFGDIIHAVKYAAGVGGATTLYFSIPSGDVYLLIEEEYELIDNVFGNL